MKIADIELETKVLAARFHKALQEAAAGIIDRGDYTEREKARLIVSALIPTFVSACSAWHDTCVDNGKHKDFARSLQDLILGHINAEGKAGSGSHPIRTDGCGL